MKDLIRNLSLLIAFFLMFSGCGSITMFQEEPGVAVEKNINAMMSAKVRGDWDIVYQYFDSNFKDKISEKDFTTPKKVIFKSYKIEYIKVDPSGEWVDALITSSITAGTFDLDGVPEKQHWIMENGKWVVVVKPSGGFID